MPLLNSVIDISHYQKVSSLKKVKADGIVGIIHKATEGRTWTDGKYYNRSRWAVEERVMWGAYHYGLRGNPKQQVDHFLSFTDPDEKVLLVLDFEATSHAPQMRRKDAEAFVERVHKLTGVWPGLYTGQSFINDTLGNDTSTSLANCWLWIAPTTPKSQKCHRPGTLIQCGNTLMAHLVPHRERSMASDGATGTNSTGLSINSNDCGTTDGSGTFLQASIGLPSCASASSRALRTVSSRMPERPLSSENQHFK